MKSTISSVQPSEESEREDPFGAMCANPVTDESRPEMAGLHSRPLTLEEKRYFLAVERGDLSTVRRIVDDRRRSLDVELIDATGTGVNPRGDSTYLDVNCMDSLGRTALLVAIDNENLDMVRLLVNGAGVELRDSLLHAVDHGFVEAVEFLLSHEETRQLGESVHGWETVERETAMFPMETNALMVAGHRDNYEILKLLLDCGARLEVPHAVRCACERCVAEIRDDSLRHTRRRFNVYRALASPSLIALTSPDPVLSAFQLADELRALAASENELKQEYLGLRSKCQDFAVDLLTQIRNSTELKLLLDYDPDGGDSNDPAQLERDLLACGRLARLKVAIDLKQKMFVTHPNVQQLLSSLWYEGLPGFRRNSVTRQAAGILRVALLFPFYCLCHMIVPFTSVGKLVRKPFVKFLVHSASYLCFLLLLIFASQRIENKIVKALQSHVWLGWNDDRRETIDVRDNAPIVERGNLPSITEWAILIYILGFIWEEMRQLYAEGPATYIGDMWNAIDLIRISLYVTTVTLRILAFIQARHDISVDPLSALEPRESWGAFDPMLIAEGLFAAANVFSFLKLLHMFSVNQHLGPLQISLGRMVIDIVKFFFVYTLVLFSFACGLNQLLWYYAELERRKCHSLPNGKPDWKMQADACVIWRRFYNLFESVQSLFWASFGMIDLKTFELTGIQSYTRFWAMLMFGSYCVVNVIVLLNLLIAMMSSSYQMISNRSDIEWKFARTKLWLNYFDNRFILPSPFNIVATPQSIFRLFGCFDGACSKTVKNNLEAEDSNVIPGNDYQTVVQALVWRYVVGKQRKSESTAVTEDTVNEIKQDISTFRYELLDIFNKNGMEVSTAAQTNTATTTTTTKTPKETLWASRRHSSSVSKKAKVWERRLLNDFSVAPVEGYTSSDAWTPPGSVARTRFREVAQLVGTRHTARRTSANRLWDNLIHEVRRQSEQVQIEPPSPLEVKEISTAALKEPDVTKSKHASVGEGQLSPIGENTSSLKPELLHPYESGEGKHCSSTGRPLEALTIFTDSTVTFSPSHKLSMDVSTERDVPCSVPEERQPVLDPSFQDSTDDLCPLLSHEAKGNDADLVGGISNMLTEAATIENEDQPAMTVSVAEEDCRPPTLTSSTQVKYSKGLGTGWF